MDLPSQRGTGPVDAHASRGTTAPLPWEEAVALQMAAHYPPALFSPGLIAVDSADASYRRLVVNNAQCSRGEPLCLELLLHASGANELGGHYLRFRGTHRRARTVLRWFHKDPATLGLHLRADTGEAALVSPDGNWLLRMDSGPHNFFATHLSIRYADNGWTHDTFLHDLQVHFVPAGQRTARRDPAARRLMADARDRWTPA